MNSINYESYHLINNIIEDEMVHLHESGKPYEFSDKYYFLRVFREECGEKIKNVIYKYECESWESLEIISLISKIIRKNRQIYMKMYGGKVEIPQLNIFKFNF